MEIPDLIGIEFQEASETVENLKKSFNVLIKETISPFIDDKYKKRECRVVRQQNFDNTIIITVSYF